MAERELVGIAKKRRKASMDFWQPVYEECVEVYRAVKCRTTPIMKTDKDGKDKEDKTRTNVCMPGISIMVRKNTARMTANPPKINYISATNQDVADKLTAASYWQYDVTNESEVTRKVVMQGEMFGFATSKIYQDDVSVRRKVRVKTQSATRQQLAQVQGANPDYPGGPDDPLTQEEIAAAVATIGDEFTYEQETKKYSGPCAKFVFLGDLHLPPACESLDSADWIIEEFDETPTWLEYMATKTYTDDKTGEEIPVMKAAVIEELIDEDRDIPESERTTLRQRFRDVMKLDTAQAPGNKDLRSSKKFHIYETHELRDGCWWIYWVGNQSKFLGEMPYPWDFYGMSAYTDYVPLPDLVNAIGDSTPRLARFLHRLHCANTGQRQDLINQYLRPMALTRHAADIPDEATQHGLFQELKLKSLDDIKIQQMPDVPAAAWQNEDAILRQLAMLEPSLASADLAGTNAEPQQGKTATVGVLAQRERDALLQYKIEALNQYFKKLFQKKLWMWQQTMQEPLEIGQSYVSDALKTRLLGNQLPQAGAAPIPQGQSNQPMAPQGAVLPFPPQQPPQDEGISMRYGKAAVIKLDWTEIQEDLQVEPEAGSTLSIEDEFHRMGWQSLWQAAQAAPHIFDANYVAKGFASTIHGIDADKAVLPPAPPPPPPPPKVSVNIAIDPSKYPADIQNQALEMIGFQPSQELVHRDTVDGIKKIGEAANAAGQLAEPAGPSAGVDDPGTAGLRKTAANSV